MDKVFSLRNRLTDLTQFRREFEQAMHALSLGKALRSDLQLVCEEVLANIVTHGLQGPEGEHAIEVRFGFDGRSLTLEFIDDGQAFNPLTHADPSLEEVDDRAIGGLGVYLVKQLTDGQQYARQGDRNHLTLIRHIEAAKTN